MQVRDDMLYWTWDAAPGEPFPEALMTAKPLHIAARRGNSQIASTLLAYGASIDGVDGNLATPLHYAASNGQTPMVKILLDSGANPNAVDLELKSPCMKAAHYGDVDVIRSLLARGADIQLRNHYGQTALHLAARSGEKDVLVFLMSIMSRHELSAEDIWGETFLFEAICRGSDLPMAFLLNHAPSAELYESRVGNILNAAVEYRPATDVRQLLRRLPTGLLSRLLSHRALDGGTPLHAAAVLAELDVMNLLLDAGAESELEGSEHGTALMGACATGRLAAVKLLVARGARTSYVKDRQCYSALLAAKYHPEVRRWVLVGRFLEGPRLLTYKEVE